MNLWVSHIALLVCIGLFTCTLLIGLPKVEGLELLTLDFTHLKAQAMYDPLYMINATYEGVGLKETTFCDKYSLYLMGLQGIKITQGSGKYYEFSGYHPFWLHKIFYYESRLVRYENRSMAMPSETSINLPISREQFDQIKDDMMEVRGSCIGYFMLYILALVVMLYYCSLCWQYDIVEDAASASGCFALFVSICSGVLTYYGSLTASQGINCQNILVNAFKNRSLMYGITVEEGMAFTALMYFIALAPLFVAFMSFCFVVYIIAIEDD